MLNLGKRVESRKAFLIIILALLVVSLLINIWLTYQVTITVQAYKRSLLDDQVVSFTNMFVDKVLLSEGDIDFDTRLALEKKVRDLNDQAIFDQWQKFTKSNTTEEASDNVKILLDMLLNKFKY